MTTKDKTVTKHEWGKIELVFMCKLSFMFFF